MTPKPIRIERRRHSLNHPWNYAGLDARQREIAAEVRAGSPGAILLSELAPVITLGRRTAAGDLPLGREFLKAQGIEVHETDRGGFGTYHGPGQWVLFVVESLERLTGDPRGIRTAVCSLLEIAREVGFEFAPDAEVRSGPETGVWTKQGKFAAVGIHVEQGILLHGLAINGFKTPQSFQGLRPCGLDAPVSFILEGAQDPGREFEALGQKILQAALKKFELSPVDSTPISRL